MQVRVARHVGDFTETKEVDRKVWKAASLRSRFYRKRGGGGFFEHPVVEERDELKTGAKAKQDGEFPRRLKENVEKDEPEDEIDGAVKTLPPLP